MMGAFNDDHPVIRMIQRLFIALLIFFHGLVVADTVKIAVASNFKVIRNYLVLTLRNDQLVVAAAQCDWFLIDIGKGDGVALEFYFERGAFSLNFENTFVGLIVVDDREQDASHGTKTDCKVGYPVPAGAVVHWLPQISEVLAFHSAQRHHGGTGAVYILLKKSDTKRKENLEKHQRRF